MFKLERGAASPLPALILAKRGLEDSELVKDERDGGCLMDAGLPFVSTLRLLEEAEGGAIDVLAGVTCARVGAEGVILLEKDGLRRSSILGPGVDWTRTLLLLVSPFADVSRIRGLMSTSACVVLCNSRVWS